MTIEGRELYCYATGTHGQRFTEEEIHKGDLWIRGLVRGVAQQYLYDFCSKGIRIEDIWTEKDIADVATQIMADLEYVCPQRKGVTYASY